MDYSNQAHIIPKFTIMARDEINKLTSNSFFFFFLILN